MSTLFYVLFVVSDEWSSSDDGEKMGKWIKEIKRDGNQLRFRNVTVNVRGSNEVSQQTPQQERTGQSVVPRQVSGASGQNSSDAGPSRSRQVTSGGPHQDSSDSGSLRTAGQTSSHQSSKSKRRIESDSSETDSIVEVENSDPSSSEHSKKPAKKKLKRVSPKHMTKKRKAFLLGSDTESTDDGAACSGSKKPAVIDVVSETPPSSEVESDDDARVRRKGKKGKGKSSKGKRESHQKENFHDEAEDNIFSQVIKGKENKSSTDEAYCIRTGSSEESDATVIENDSSKSNSPDFMTPKNKAGTKNKSSAAKQPSAVKLPSLHLRLSTEDEDDAVNIDCDSPVVGPSHCLVTHTAGKLSKSGAAGSVEDDTVEYSQPLLEPVVPVRLNGDDGKKLTLESDKLQTPVGSGPVEVDDDDLPTLSQPRRRHNSHLSLSKSKRNLKFTQNGNSSADSTPSKGRVFETSWNDIDNASPSKDEADVVIESDDDDETQKISSSDSELDTPLKDLASRRISPRAVNINTIKSEELKPGSSCEQNDSTHSAKDNGGMKREESNQSTEVVPPSVDSDKLDALINQFISLKKKTTSSSSTDSEVIPYQGTVTKNQGQSHESEFIRPGTSGISKDKSSSSSTAIDIPSTSGANVKQTAAGALTDSEVGRDIKQEVEEVKLKLDRKWTGDSYTMEDDCILIDSDSDDGELLQSMSQDTVALKLEADVDHEPEDVDASMELQNLLDMSDTEIMEEEGEKGLERSSSTVSLESLFALYVIIIEVFYKAEYNVPLIH